VKKILTVILAVLLGGTLIAAEKLKKITLKDASVIIGRVIEMKDAQYTVETEALGALKLDEDNIIEIRTLGSNEDAYTDYQPSEPGKPHQDIQIQDGAKRQKSSPARQKYEESLQPSGSNDMNRQQEEVNSRVKSMTADGDFLESLMDLSENNSMMDVMSDPEVMDAISRNDYDFLMNNEKMKNLMDSSEIKDLLGGMEP